MIYSVVFTEEAERDLRSIFQYIAFELKSAGNAAAQVMRIETAINGLRRMPERFRMYEKTKWRKRGLRIMPVDRYCVFYIPNERDATVTVVRILYSGRDMDNILSETE